MFSPNVTPFVLIGILETILAAPYLDTTPLTINSAEGEQVVLPCIVKNLGFSSIIWFSPTGAPLVKDTHVYAVDKRISVENPDMTTFNLVIENVIERDAGVYVCMVLGGMSERRVTLNVLAPPQIDTQRSTPNLKVIEEGDTLRLQCIATGKPEPVIKWYRTVDTDLNHMTREDLGTTGSVLTIRDIAREAAGSYHCEVSNNIDPDASREIIVTVHFQPQIYPQNDKLSRKPGKNVIFECIAEGYPLPNVVWERNGELLPKDTQKYRQDLYEEKDTLVLSLRIDNLQDNDFGIYTCDASNVYGRTSHEFIIEKTGAPKIEVASTLVRKMKSENAELECRVRGFPRSVVWFKNRQKLTQTRRYSIENYPEDDIYVSSLTILTLEMSDFAVYVCQAENGFGSDEMAIRLERSAIDISAPAEVNVGREISMICNATTDSIGEDEISWLKNGRSLKLSSRITISRDINVEDQRIYSKLYIRDMKIGDKGTYTCQTKKYLSASHSLSIVELPDDFVTIDRKASSPEMLTVKEDSGEIKLTCKVEAYPRIMIYWYRYEGESNGRKHYQELTSGDEELILDSDRSVAGTYQCRATNGKKEEETLDITVDIQYPVKVNILSDKIHKEIGASLITECNMTGNPLTRSVWVSPKGPNKTFDHTLDMAFHDNYVTVAMKIMKLNLEDFGTYTCIGENVLGKDTATITVVPIFPTTTTSTTSTTVTMTTKPTTTTTAMSSTTMKRKTTTEFVELIVTETDEPKYFTKKTTPKYSTKRKTKKPMTTTPLSIAEQTDYPRQTGKEQVQHTGDNKSSRMEYSCLVILLTVIIAFQYKS